MTAGTHYKVPGLDNVRATAVQTFDSLAAICEARLKAGTKAKLPSFLSLSGGENLGPNWYGSASMQEAIGMLRHGSPVATETVRAYVQQATATDHRPAWEHSVAGQRVCIASYVAGSPECMLTRDTESAQTPRIRLIASSNVLSIYKADDVLRYAGAVASIIEALQVGGYDLAFVACEFNQSYEDGRHATPVSVLGFGQPVDLSKIAFAMHPSMQRRVQFAVREMDSGYAEGLRCDGKGKTARLDAAAVAKLFPATDDTLTICLPCASDAIDATQRGGTDKMLSAMVALLRETVDKAIAARAFC